MTNVSHGLDRHWRNAVRALLLSAVCGAAMAQQGAASRALMITNIAPAGTNVPEGRQIVIQFNRPVVPIGRMDRTAAEIPIEISPKGRDRLEQLSRIENHPRAEDIRREAKAALERRNPWEPARVDSATFLASIVVQPSGRTLDPQLVELASAERLGSPYGNDGKNVAGLFVDLNHDGAEEFVLLRAGDAVVFSNSGGGWRRLTEMLTDRFESLDAVVARVRAGDFRVEASQWDDLVVGGVRYRLPPRAQ